MRTIFKSVLCVTALFLLLAPFSYAESEYVDDWLGLWTVTMDNQTVITWEITDTWVSDTGMSHLAYGVTSPGNVEFIIVYNGMFQIYIYIEKAAGTTVYDLPQDLSKYTQLIPSTGFNTFTVKNGGLYPILSGYKGTVPPEPEPETCTASYLLGEGDQRLKMLRQFRDDKLAKSSTGKRIISMYYKTSSDIIDICKKSPIAKRFFKLILMSVLPAINILCNAN